MAAPFGSLRHSFAERSKERLLSRKEYSELGLGPQARGRGRGDAGGGGGRAARPFVGAFYFLWDKSSEFWNYVKQVANNSYKIGRSDPRKIIFALKMAMALSLVSVLIFFKEPLSYIGQYSIWAILTVVVVFEFSIGTPSVLFLSFVLILLMLFGS